MKATLLALFSLFVITAYGVSMFPLPNSYRTMDHCGRQCFYGDFLYISTGFKLKGYALSMVTPIESGAVYLQGSGEQFIIAPFYSSVDNSIARAPADSGIFYGLYSGSSPIDGMLQIQSQAYFMATWNKVGYEDDHMERLNSFQVVMSTDNVDTYVCFIYPDDVATGNRNGGIDWALQSRQGLNIGFSFPSYHYYLPDTESASATGLDGVPGDGQAARFAGTHAVGQYCYFVSGPTVIPMGPPAITSPSPSQYFTAANIRSVSFVSNGLLNSRNYNIRVNGQTFQSLTSASTGTLSSTLDLSGFPEGPLTISLFRVSDSTISASVSIFKYTVPPRGSVTSPTQGTTLTSNLVTVRGSGDVGANVVVTISDSDSSTRDIITSPLTIGASGTWEFTNVDISSLFEGPVSFLVTFSDPAGNTATVTVDVMKDTGASVSITAPISGSYITAATSSSVLVTGRGDAGGTVSVFVGATLMATTTVNQNQFWSLYLNLASFGDVTFSLVASIIDPAGNQASSTPVTLIKDTSTFVAITSPVSGIFINQRSVSALQVSGTGEIGGSVVVKIEDSTSSTLDILATAVQVAASGTWVISPLDISSQADGMIRVTASITDAAGNTFTSDPVSLNKDTMVSVHISSPTSNQFVVSSARAASVSIAGYGDAGTAVAVTVSDSDSFTQNIVSSTVEVSPVGTWSVTLNLSRLSDGLLNIIATASDLAGNIGTSNTVNLNKDTGISGFSITSPTAGSSISESAASSLSISGTGESGGSVSLRITGTSGLISRTVFVIGSAWSTVVNVSNMPNGLLTISGTGSDVAGNSGAIPPVQITKGSP